MNAVQVALGYHQRTKHHYHRYARALGYLDWATQPDPFRRFAGAPAVLLPFSDPEDSPSYADLYVPGRVRAKPLGLASVAELFEYALGISAWKQYKEARWSLRINPSSGNLHPTEGYLVAPPLAESGAAASAAVWHYAPMEHALERRAAVPPEVWAKLTEAFPEGTFFVGLSSIHWREAWKYGERAYRYCNHDTGHAIACVALAASLIGRRALRLDGLGDREVARLLGLNRRKDFEGAEAEHPDCVLAVVPAEAAGPIPMGLPEIPLAHLAGGAWTGRANALSSDHVDWEVIPVVAEAATKPHAELPPRRFAGPAAPSSSLGEGVAAKQILRQRRSAVDMDGRTSISREAFYAMLARTMPRAGAIPWEAIPLPARVHLGLFVHRVDGIPPGLYALPRSEEGGELLRKAMKASFLWDSPPECPKDLPLFLLDRCDCRAVAASVSCQQAIAGDGAFSLG
ncbi:MAG: SagB/ThcOx family dehydrogenase, partial [Candidatus Methylomirabilis sp.]|nr:SagB/ThcOx family dehydrogenase [Deltaproteobacteria bacterium]